MELAGTHLVALGFLGDRRDVDVHPGAVRAKSITLPKRQNRILPPVIFLVFRDQAERFDTFLKYSEFCSDSAH